jgi:hypothetical protein
MYGYLQDIAPAIADCKTLKSADMAASCINGAYMQLFTLPLREFTDDELLEFCGTQPVPELFDCFLYAPTLYLERHKSDHNAALEWCATHKDEKESMVCASGVIAEATKRNITSIEEIWQLCKDKTDLPEEMCVHSIVTMFINHHAATRSAVSICPLFAEHRAHCMYVIEEHLLSKEMN